MTAPFLGSASGLTPQRLRAKRYRHLGRDLYLATDQQVDLLRRTQAALLVLPDAVACLRTAAVLQHLPADDDGVVHLARGRTAARSERAGVTVHRTPVADDERLSLGAFAVTDGPAPAWTWRPRRGWSGSSPSGTSSCGGTAPRP